MPCICRNCGPRIVNGALEYLLAVCCGVCYHQVLMPQAVCWSRQHSIELKGLSY